MAFSASNPSPNILDHLCEDIRLMIWEILVCDFPPPVSPDWDFFKPHLPLPDVDLLPDGSPRKRWRRPASVPDLGILGPTNRKFREEALGVFLKAAQFIRIELQNTSNVESMLGFGPFHLVCTGKRARKFPWDWCVERHTMWNLPNRVPSLFTRGKDPWWPESSRLPMFGLWELQQPLYCIILRRDLRSFCRILEGADVLCPHFGRSTAHQLVLHPTSTGFRYPEIMDKKCYSNADGILNTYRSELSGFETVFVDGSWFGAFACRSLPTPEDVFRVTEDGRDRGWELLIQGRLCEAAETWVGAARRLTWLHRRAHLVDIMSRGGEAYSKALRELYIDLLGLSAKAWLTVVQEHLKKLGADCLFQTRATMERRRGEWVHLLILVRVKDLIRLLFDELDPPFKYRVPLVTTAHRISNARISCYVAKLWRMGAAAPQWGNSEAQSASYLELAAQENPDDADILLEIQEEREALRRLRLQQLPPVGPATDTRG